MVDAGLSGSDIRGIMLEAVERRVGTCRMPSVIAILSDNGLPMQGDGHTGLCAPVRAETLRPTGAGVHKAVVSRWPLFSDHRLARRQPPKRGYVPVTPLPDAQTIRGSIGSWFDDDKPNHPRSRPRMRARRECITAQTATAWVSGETGAGPTVARLKCRQSLFTQHWPSMLTVESKPL